VGVLKFPKLGPPKLWEPITLCVDLWLNWGLRKSCSPCWDLSNGMSHATCTQINWGDSQLLMVGSQIGSLTRGPSFGHNLCFKSRNGSCQLILNIYVPRIFNGIKYFSMQWILTLTIAFWRFNSPLGLHPQSENSFGSVGVHSLTLFCTLGSMKCGSQAHFWPAPLQALALVVSPRLRLWHYFFPSLFQLKFFFLSVTNHNFFF
jgi:hypothetical protein